MTDTVFTLTAGPVDAYPEVLAACLARCSTITTRLSWPSTKASSRRRRRALRMTKPPTILHGEPVLGPRGRGSLADRPDRRRAQPRVGRLRQGLRLLGSTVFADLVEIEVAYNEAIDPARSRHMFKAHPEITIVSVCHHDTPSGTINPVREIGAMVSAHGGYLIVDAVSSFGGMDIHPEDCRADIYVTGPEQVPRVPAGADADGRERPRLGQDEVQPGRAPRFDAQHPRLEGRMAGREAVPVHALGGRNQRARRRARPLSQRGAGAGLGAPRADGGGVRAGVAAMGLAIWPARATPSPRPPPPPFDAGRGRRRGARAGMHPATASWSRRAGARHWAS